MADGRIADETRGQYENRRTTAAIIAVYCASAAAAGITMAMGVLKIIEIVHPF